MKWLFGLLVAAALGIGAFCGVGLFVVPASVQVSRAAQIDRPASIIYPLLANLRAFNEISPWFDADPKALRVIGWLAVAAGGVAAGTGAFLLTRSPAGSSRRLVSIECLALGGAVVLSGGTIAVVTTWRSNASDHETAASVSLAGRF